MDGRRWQKRQGEGQPSEKFGPVVQTLTGSRRVKMSNECSREGRRLFAKKAENMTRGKKKVSIKHQIPWPFNRFLKK